MEQGNFMRLSFVVSALDVLYNSSQQMEQKISPIKFVPSTVDNELSRTDSILRSIQATFFAKKSHSIDAYT